MAENDTPKPKRSSGKRRRRRRSNKRSYQTPKDLAVCPICEQNIRDVLTAIIVSSDGTAAHFDCVVRKITADEELGPREKICYLGGGEFGIVHFKSQDQRRFSVRKRIKFEEKEHIPDWHREISKGLSR